MRAGCCGRLDDRVKEFDARIEEIARRTPARRRLQAIPGIGPLTATAPSAAAPARPADRGRRALIGQSAVSTNRGPAALGEVGVGR